MQHPMHAYIHERTFQVSTLKFLLFEPFELEMFILVSVPRITCNHQWKLEANLSVTLHVRWFPQATTWEMTKKNRPKPWPFYLNSFLIQFLHAPLWVYAYIYSIAFPFFFILCNQTTLWALYRVWFFLYSFYHNCHSSDLQCDISFSLFIVFIYIAHSSFLCVNIKLRDRRH